MSEVSSHTGSNKIDLDSTPPAARRLWSELFCMCGECDQIQLAQCACDFAAAERKRMTEQFVKAGLADASKQEAAYGALLAEYVKRHGAAAEVANSRFHAWLDPLLMLAGALAAFVALVVIVERLRARLRQAEGQQLPDSKRNISNSPRRRRR